MAETTNIAKMAEKLSAELFGEFFWERVGPANDNWACVNQGHQKATKKSPTHPSDVVFYYDNPYQISRTYVTLDLKSYAAGSVTALGINAAAMGLARTLSCAEKSHSFREKYLHPSVTAEICGLLFVYNHDGQYDHNFHPLIAGINHEHLEVPRGSKLIVLGPEDIFWLNNVSRDLVQMRGKGTLPAKEQYRFYYPNLVLKKYLQPHKAKAATIEMLTAPWIILQYQFPVASSKRGYVIYYRPKGKCVEEFVYLIDYILHYQLLDDGIVDIKTLDPEPNAQALFDKAIDEYIDAQDADDDLKAQLKERITFSQLVNLAITFSAVEIGMDNA